MGVAVRSKRLPFFIFLPFERHYIGPLHGVIVDVAVEFRPGRVSVVYRIDYGTPRRTAMQARASARAFDAEE